MSGVFTLGETMALFETEEGSLEHAHTARVSIGGAESNVATALARLGTDVTWLGRVGSDPLGARIRRELQAEGINVLAVTDVAAPTAVMIKEHRLPGRSRVIYHRRSSAGANLQPSDLDAIPVAAADAVHVTGITTAISDSALRTVHASIDRSAPGAVISFDINHRAGLWRGRDSRPTYSSVAARSSIVFAGLDEARLLTGSDGTPQDLAERTCALGPRAAVIKLGSEGAIAFVDGHHYAAPAHRVPVVDTVGAGDAFVAGYLSEMLAGHPPDMCLRTANAVAAFACMGRGDWEGYPRREELALLAVDEPVTR